MAVFAQVKAKRDENLSQVKGGIYPSSRLDAWNECCWALSLVLCVSRLPRGAAPLVLPVEGRGYQPGLLSGAAGSAGVTSVWPKSLP
jgi:hypothetical protein